MVNVGIIGGGLMGREAASAILRWCALEVPAVQPQILAVADANPDALAWYERIPSISLRATDYRELLRMPEIDLVYVAVPHDLHEQIYTDVLNAGKDLFAEKPFGMDLHQAMNIAMAARTTSRFVRCSSEFPFYPAVKRIVDAVREGSLGRIIEVRAGFWHSSDLDPNKPINWKRQKARCGEAGVMNDLGLHVWHIPLRLGWKPVRVHAQLSNIFEQRQDSAGTWVPCDTDDNAVWNVDATIEGHEVPMRLEVKRIMPGEMNTWFFEVYGTQSSMKFSTKEPKTLWTFRRDKDQVWERTDVGHVPQFPVITGGIFEFGFPDAFLQMWAALIAERSGCLGKRLGCATVDECLKAHQLNEAALTSWRTKSVVEVDL